MVEPSIAIQPLDRPVHATVRVPGSKSFTNRALPIAAMAHGPSVLSNVLESDDTAVMLDSLRRLGIALDHDRVARTVRIEGCGGELPVEKAALFLGNSGTSIRFLASMLATAKGEFTLDGVDRMRQRPIGDLLTALGQLGVDARSVHGNGCPPIAIRASGVTGGKIAVRGEVSSQFLSGLLMMAPAANANIEIAVDGPLVSKPYIDMTLATMQAFGGKYHRDGYERFNFTPGTGYRGCDYVIEPDASAASYFFAAAAIAGGEVTVDGLGSQSLQGDLGFVRVLESMGCRVEMTADRTTVFGGSLIGVDVDMCDLSDTVMTLAAVACFANCRTRIRNVAHIRHKETDRIAALATELRKAGVTVVEFDDGLEISPARLHSAEFDTYDDHRMAMGLALLGLRQSGIVVRDPGCTAKTYPEFWRDLRSL